MLDLLWIINTGCWVCFFDPTFRKLQPGSSRHDRARPSMSIGQIGCVKSFGKLWFFMPFYQAKRASRISRGRLDSWPTSLGWRKNRKKMWPYWTNSSPPANSIPKVIPDFEHLWIFFVMTLSIFESLGFGYRADREAHDAFAEFYGCWAVVPTFWLQHGRLTTRSTSQLHNWSTKVTITWDWID